MAGKKGMSHTHYSLEFKLEIVNKVLQQHQSSRQIAYEIGIDDSLIRRWVRAYNKDGVEGLKEKHSHKGNRFAALHTSKSLSKEDRLELTIEKLKVENERLKKGYIVKGVGASKAFVTLKELNSK